MSIVMVFTIVCMYIISNTNVYAIENEKELSLETDSYINNEGMYINTLMYTGIL